MSRPWPLKQETEQKGRTKGPGPLLDNSKKHTCGWTEYYCSFRRKPMPPQTKLLAVPWTKHSLAPPSLDCPSSPRPPRKLIHASNSWTPSLSSSPGLPHPRGLDLCPPLCHLYFVFTSTALTITSYHNLIMSSLGNRNQTLFIFIAQRLVYYLEHHSCSRFGECKKNERVLHCATKRRG